MSADQRIFAAIDRLIAERGKPAADIAALTEAKLERNAASSNTFFTFWEGVLPAGRPFSRIEYRESTNPLIAKGLFILNRPIGDCIELPSIVARYGRDFSLSPPLAGSPPDYPVYYAYTRDWGELSFGLTPNPPQCLVRVVINWAK